MKKEKKRYQRHTKEKKLDLIRMYESGARLKQLSIQGNVHPSLLKLWIQQYRELGESGLSMRNASYTAELKVKVVLDVLNNHLSLHQASIRYRITRSVVEKWVRKAQLLGLPSLSTDGRKKPPQKPMRTKKKQPPRALSREEELEQELAYLRAENAFLKKLRALVEERVARESGSTPKPSKR